MFGLNIYPVPFVIEPNNAIPVFDAWLEIQTNGGGPWNNPVPPRTCNVWSSYTSQLKPTLGDNCKAFLGAKPVFKFTPP